MKRLVYVYKPDTPNNKYVNIAADCGNVEVEINEPLETLLKSNCHLVVAKTGDGKLEETLVQLEQQIARISGDHLRGKLYDLTAHLRTLWKSDSRPVLKTDLPTPSVQEAPASDPVVPKTPLELCNLLSDLDSAHLGTIVGQLLVSKCVSLERFQYALGHSRRLVQASGKLRQELLNILQNKLPEEEEEEDE